MCWAIPLLSRNAYSYLVITHPWFQQSQHFISLRISFMAYHTIIPLFQGTHISNW
jgi:hypothetical protein